ncbi:MAG: alpha/beta hydrolase [Terriglobales bacterium]
MKKLAVALFVCVCTLSFAKTEIGELHGVPFRIDVPDSWNHNLIVYYHGYSTAPVKYKEGDPNPVLAEFTKRGYAVVQSAYSRTGWAVEQAVPETEALRRYFGEKYGTPKETLVAGHSMGGFLTAETMERFPQTYAAGLALCGALEPAPELLDRPFHFIAVFNYYFPGLLPPPDKIPADFNFGDETIKHVEQDLNDNPKKAAAFRQFAKLKSNKEAAGTAVFLTYVLKDVQQRSGGNPFSNRDTIYSGSPDDNRLNEGVKRYDATAPLAYLKANYSLTGKLQHPVLAVHTTYDQLVLVEVPNHYALMTDVAGSGNMFVQQYVEHNGHCNISPEEVGKGFDELLTWTHQHVRPQGSHLMVPATK